MKTAFACVVLGLFLIPCALSLQCEFCNAMTKSNNAPSCNRTEPQLVECGSESDRCGTVTVTMDSPDEPPLQMKNCSTALACDPEVFNMCEMLKAALNRSGIPLKTCAYECCEGDGCNSMKSVVTSFAQSSTVKPVMTQNPTDADKVQDGAGSGYRAAVHFGAMFFALVLAFVCQA